MIVFKDLMKYCVWAGGKYLGIFRFCRWYTADDLRILCYHGIWDNPDYHFGDALFMSPATFFSRLELLSKGRYPVLSLEEAVTGLATGNLQKHAVVITIDDGWYGTYAHMLPALERHEYPATLYMTTYYAEHQIPVTNVVIRLMLERTTCRTLDLTALPISLDKVLPLDSEVTIKSAIVRIMAAMADTDIDAQEKFCNALGQQLGIDYPTLAASRQLNLMNHQEIRDASSRNLDIQLHTHRHRTSHDGQHVLGSEIQENREILEQLTGKQATHFCYPSGIYQAEQDWPVLAQEGVSSATTCELGFNQTSAERFGLKRILDAQSVSALEFEGEMCGFGELLRNVRARVAGLFSQTSSDRP